MNSEKYRLYLDFNLLMEIMDLLEEVESVSTAALKQHVEAKMKQIMLIEDKIKPQLTLIQGGKQ